jgi:hypothetical protein
VENNSLWLPILTFPCENDNEISGYIIVRKLIEKLTAATLLRIYFSMELDSAFFRRV